MFSSLFHCSTLWGGSFVFAQETTFTEEGNNTTVTNLPVNQYPNSNEVGYRNVALPGDGSEGHPYEIGTVDQWNAFAWLVNNAKEGNDHIKRGAYAKITADITFTNNHLQPSDFKGTLDGQGHTITLHQNDVLEAGDRFSSYKAQNRSWGGLFLRAGDGITIKNLRLAGEIRNKQNDCGTFIQNICGSTCTLENCQSSVKIIRTADGNYSGGLTGGNDGSSGKIIILNCLVNGMFKAGGYTCNYNGGFIGKSNNCALEINNSYAQPQEVDSEFGYFYPFWNFKFGNTTYNVTISESDNYYYNFPTSAHYVTTGENQGADKAAPAAIADLITGLNSGDNASIADDQKPWIAHNDTVYLRTFAKYVHIESWTYGSPNDPSVVGNNGNATVTYKYKVQGEGDDTYTTTKPTNVGNYTVLAIVPATESWNGWTSTMNFSISQKEVTVSGITAENKTYNGNTTATLNYTNVIISGKEGGDELTASASSGTFDDANVGEDKTVTISGLTLSGSNAGNYTLADLGQQTTTTANITKTNLTITAKPKSITYGDAPANDDVNYSGFVNSENSAVLGGTLSYAYNYAQYGDVGSYTITPSGLTSNNYEITFNAGTLTVEKKEVGLSWSTPTTFTYDGQSHCLTATATGLVNQDAITVTVYGAQTNADNHTATASALTGDKSGNYKLPDENTQGFTINKMQVVVSGITASDKTYDKNTTATLVYDNITFTPPIVAGDNLSVTASGTFPNEYVGVDKTVTISGLTLSGTSVDNYELAGGEQQTSATASITPKTVGLNWSATSFDYDGTAKAPTATATGLEAGDEGIVTVNVPGEHTAVGFYTATATSFDNTNYSLPTSPTQDYQIVRPMTGIEFTASKHWNTYCAFENLATPEGITAYIVTGTNGDKATTSQIDYIPQGVGVLLYGTAGSDFRASAYTGATGSFTTNKLVGVTAATTIAAEAGYVLYGDAFVLTTGGSLPANRSYLPVSGAALTRSLIIEGGDGATSIESIEDHQATDGRWFDMQGRRIDKPKKKGLYILDGKKIVIK